MKKFILSFLVFTIFSLNSNSQLLTENFDFSNANSLGANGWVVHSGTADSIYTTTGLTYAGYAGSGIGLAANVVGAGYDYNRAFDTLINNGTSVYLSFLIKVTESATSPSLAGGNILHLGYRAVATSFTSFLARLYIKSDSTTGNINFGLSNTSTITTYAPLNYLRNTTYLIIIKYTINTAGADPIKMWIISSGVPATEAAAGTPDFESTTSTSGQDKVNSFAIRQTTGIPDAVLDGIRIDTSWSGAPLPIKLTSFNAVGLKSTVNLNWLTHVDQTGGSFGIERSVDGSNFENISTVAANSIGNASYEMTDKNLPTVKTLYYRLKIVNADGRYEYSNIQKVILKDVKLTVSPNPANNEILINASENIKSIEVYDINGRRMIVKENINLNQTRINVTTLKDGTYIVKTLVDGEVTTNQIMVKH